MEVSLEISFIFLQKSDNLSNNMISVVNIGYSSLAGGFIEKNVDFLGKHRVFTPPFWILTVTRDLHYIY